MNFITYKTLSLDCLLWSRDLPRDFDAIVPIPRSGYLPASILALHMHTHLLTADQIVGGNTEYVRSKFKNKPIKKVLVVDDSVASGNTIAKFKDQYGSLLKSMGIEVKYGALYYSQKVLNRVDYGYKDVEPPRMFQWNFIHHGLMKKSAVDMDGFLCCDPSHDDDGEKYIAEISTIRPIYIPSVPVLAIVTCRLEKYRTYTENWLKSHGVNYKHLIMMDYKTKAERVKAGRHADFKAEAFMMTGAELFVESSKPQADKIRKITGKPVICIEEML